MLLIDEDVRDCPLPCFLSEVGLDIRPLSAHLIELENLDLRFLDTGIGFQEALGFRAVGAPRFAEDCDLPLGIRDLTYPRQVQRITLFSLMVF